MVNKYYEYTIESRKGCVCAQHIIIFCLPLQYTKYKCCVQYGLGFVVP